MKKGDLVIIDNYWLPNDNKLIIGTIGLVVGRVGGGVIVMFGHYIHTILPRNLRFLNKER